MFGDKPIVGTNTITCEVSRGFSVHAQRARTENTEGPLDEQGNRPTMEEIGKNESIRVVIDNDVVIAEGDIDLAGGPLLDMAILRLADATPIVIDLTAVEFIDSSGLRSLLTASRRAEGRDSYVVLR